MIVWSSLPPSPLPLSPLSLSLSLYIYIYIPFSSSLLRSRSILPFFLLRSVGCKVRTPEYSVISTFLSSADEHGISRLCSFFLDKTGIYSITRSSSTRWTSSGNSSGGGDGEDVVVQAGGGARGMSSGRSRRRLTMRGNKKKVSRITELWKCMLRGRNIIDVTILLAFPHGTISILNYTHFSQSDIESFGVALSLFYMGYVQLFFMLHDNCYTWTFNWCWDFIIIILHMYSTIYYIQTDAKEQYKFLCLTFLEH
jgi:hypothetical protein